MPLAIVATPTPLPDLRPAPGSLDGDLMRARLPLADLGFTIVDLDPSVDVAEQLEVLFDREAARLDGPVLFYVSCAAVLSEDGEIFLCLDPANPDTGDSLRDIAAVFAERVRGPTSFLIECRHLPNPDDPFRAALLVSAAKDAVSSSITGIELLVAARPFEGEVEDVPSPLTRAVVATLDDVEPGRSLTAQRLYERVRDSEVLVGAVPCFAHAAGKAPFHLLTGDEPDAPPEEEEEQAPAPLPRLPRGMEGPAVVASPPAAHVAPVVLDEAPASDERRSMEEDAIHVSIDEAPFLEALKPQPVPSMPSAQKDERQLYSPEPAPSAPPPARLPVDLPRVIISDRPPPLAPEARLPTVPPPPAVPTFRGSQPPPHASQPPGATPMAAASPASEPLAVEPTAADHLAAGDGLLATGDGEAALVAFRKALGLLGGAASAERADVYVRIGEVKRQQGKRREAISNLEKALGLVSQHREALEQLLTLNVAEGDLRAVQSAEERVLALIPDAEERSSRLADLAARWEETGSDLARARALLERARDLRPADLWLMQRLQRLYERTHAGADALAMRRRIAELTPEPRARAERYFDLAKHCLSELKREDLALELFDLALESDPSMLEPLAVVATVLAERQEWSELEGAYRRMLDRAPRIPIPEVRTEVTWELCRRLGLLFRDHLDDPALALDAFEDSLAEKPGDLAGHLAAADLAGTVGKTDRAAHHLQRAAVLDPARAQTYHELFSAFQRLRRPDQAYSAASVTMHQRQAEPRERFLFEEHRPESVPKLRWPLRADGWELLRVQDRDRHVEGVLAAIAPPAIAARLGGLAADGRLPVLDPAARQDPQKTSLSIVRSFAWASHFLGVAAPAIYVRDDAAVTLAAVVAEEPTVIAGSGVLRGRSLHELAFLVGRHLAYHVGGHRLLLYYPSIEELSACFLAGIAIVLPDVPVPMAVRSAALALRAKVEPHLSAEGRGELEAAVGRFQGGGKVADLGGWVGAVERCATRAGYVLCGDLEVAAGVLASEPRGFVAAADKLGDLYAFAVSEEHAAVRETFGIAIEP